MGEYITKNMECKWKDATIDEFIEMKKKTAPMA